MTERLDNWITHIGRLEWSAFLLDDDWRLHWVSPQLKEQLGETDEVALHYGSHLVDAFLSPAWRRTIHPDSQAEMLQKIGPYILSDLEERGRNFQEILPEPLLGLAEYITPEEPPDAVSFGFQYLDPRPDAGLDSYRVNLCFMALRDEEGSIYGYLVLFFIGMRPSLLELLVRGDEAMYERMANLQEPAQREGAILFCDLSQSAPLARQLPTARYFRLVRDLWTGIDRAVADELGIIGKHAGDGASAFFLVENLGSASSAAAAAIRAARRIHEIAEEVTGDVIEEPGAMRVGIHWGAQLYIGQLVPGGRLDVTALGDDVNEGARIQEAAPPGETQASKQLIERLEPDDASSLGLDAEKLFYRTLADMPGAPEKAIRDAGALAVTSL